MTGQYLDQWDRCAPWLQAALDAFGGTHTLADVRQLVDAGKAQFWPHPEAAGVTQVITYPRLNSLRLWLGGGSIAGLLALQPYVEQFAKAEGCSRVEIMGRPGWARILGYRRAAAAMMKEI